MRRLTSSGLGVAVSRPLRSTLDDETLVRAPRMAAFCAVAEDPNREGGSGDEQDDISASDASEEGRRSETAWELICGTLGHSFGESTTSIAPTGDGDILGLPGGRFGGPMYGVGRSAAIVSLAGFLGAKYGRAGIKGI